MATTADPGMMPTDTTLTPIEAFELEYKAVRRRSKIAWTVGSIIFIAIFLWTTWFSGFYEWPMTTLPDGERAPRWVISAGFSKLDDFLLKLLPTLSWSTLGADIANWFWAFKKWMWIIFETIINA